MRTLSKIFFFLTLILPEIVLSQTISVSHWKAIEDFTPLLTTSQIQIKDAIKIDASEISINGISAINIIESKKNYIKALIFSDDALNAQWFEIKIPIDEHLKINTKSILILSSGVLLDEQKNKIGGLEATEIHEGNLYASFDNDIPGSTRNFVLQYKLSTKKSSWEAVQKIVIGDLKSFPSQDAFDGNAGLEALTITDDGYIFTIYEKGSANKMQAWRKNLFRTDEPTTDFTYHSEFSEIKAATTLINGDILVLEKDYNSINETRFSIQKIDRKKLNRGKELTPKDVLRTKFSATLYDNFEGMASFPFNNKELVIIVSDNNNNSKQNTLFFLFELMSDDDNTNSDDHDTDTTIIATIVLPENIPFPVFNKSEDNHFSFVKKNRQLLLDSRNGATLWKMKKAKKRVRAIGIPINSSLSVAVTPRTLRGLGAEITGLSITLDGKDFSYNKSIGDLYESALGGGKASPPPPAPTKEDSINNKINDQINKIKSSIVAPTDLESFLIKRIPAQETLIKTSGKNLKAENDKTKKVELLQELRLQLLKTLPKKEKQTRREQYFKSVYSHWVSGDKYIHFNELKKLAEYKSTLRRAVQELQKLEGLTNKESLLYDSIIRWIPNEIILTRFPSVSPDNDEIEIKLKSYKKDNIEGDEIIIDNRRLSSGLGINIGTALFFTGLKINQAYINDSVPLGDTTFSRRAYMPLDTPSLSLGVGVNIELSFRTAHIIRPTINLGFFIPLGEEVSPFFALGGGFTIGTKKIKFSASAGLALGNINVIKKRYRGQVDLLPDLALDDIVEKAWRPSWQASIGISYNIANPK